MPRKQNRRLRFESLEHRNLLAADIAYVRHFDTWDGAVRSTDPAGIMYHAPSGHLYLVDSEIDELPAYFVGNNVFEVSTRGDTVYRQIASKNSEPTGITYNAFDGFFYVVNDDTRKITRYDSRLNVPLATVDTRTATPNAADPEDITSDPATGTLYVVDGKGGGKQVLVYNSSLVFQYRFYIGDRISDGEGIAFDPASKTLFIVSTPKLAIFEYTTTGQYIQTFDLSSFVPRPLTPQGLAVGPTSDPNDSPDAMALYIADGMVDNFADGRVYETVIDRGDPNIKSIESRVAVGSDDAEEKASGGVTLTSSDLELVYDGSNQVVGLRFAGINIPRGASIVDAHVQFQVDVPSVQATSLRIQGQAIDNAPTFAATTRNVSSRARTSASVNFSPPAWPTAGAAGVDQRTPNLASILQQIIDRPGWLPGNALALLISGTGLRAAEAFEGGATRAPVLRVDYRTDITPPNAPPEVNAGPDLTAAVATPINLDGTVTDDGRPHNSLTTSWSQLSGPDTVVFGSTSAVDTTATFPKIGTYVLQLAAFDGALASSDTITVQVTGKTSNVRIAAGSDDAEERPNGSVNLTSGDLELVFDAEYQANQTVGLRFNGLNIPRDATILDAYIQFQVDESFSDPRIAGDPRREQRQRGNIRRGQPKHFGPSASCDVGRLCPLPLGQPLDLPAPHNELPTLPPSSSKSSTEPVGSRGIPWHY